MVNPHYSACCEQYLPFMKRSCYQSRNPRCSWHLRVRDTYLRLATQAGSSGCLQPWKPALSIKPAGLCSYAHRVSVNHDLYATVLSSKITECHYIDVIDSALLIHFDPSILL